MKQNIALCVAFGLTCLPLMSSAADGTIHFTGSVLSPGCVVAARSSPAEINVALPPVSTSSLRVSGQTAGRTPFFITVAGCNIADTQVGTYFEPGPTVNAGTNNLSIESGADAAGNVELQILNRDLSKVRLGVPHALQNARPVTTSDGEVSIPFYAEYVATGAATAGRADSSVMFTLVYR